MGEIKSPSQKHQRKTSNIAKLLQDASLSERSTEPNFEKVNDAELDIFRGAPASANLVLFTPAIPSSSDIDPFEPLGKALSTYHARVRHVPYLPSRGMTSTHTAFCNTAGSVVIVVCQIIENQGPISGASLKGQQNFVRDVRDVAKMCQAPILLVEIGDGDCSYGFNLVVKCEDYANDTQEKIADLIFHG